MLLPIFESRLHPTRAAFYMMMATEQRTFPRRLNRLGILNRVFWVTLHRWAGLAMFLFVTMAALTGTLLAFYHELDEALNPLLFTVETGEELLTPLALKDIALEYAGEGARVPSLPLRLIPGHAIEMSVQGVSEFNRLYLDPHTGEVLGTRRWGDISAGVSNLMPFIYKLHYSLAVPGKWGLYVMGAVALVWTLDCFVGFYLTLPRPSSKKPSSTGVATRRPADRFRSRWSNAWLLRWRSGGLKLNFDLHRAGGLWLWPMLLVFAWSGVGFNLSTEVFRPVMGSVFELSHPVFDLPRLQEPLAVPKLDWPEALAAARLIAAQQAPLHKLEINWEFRLQYLPAQGVYRYRVNSNRDIHDRYGSTEFYLDGNTVEFRGAYFPTGQASGNTVTSWLYGLHMGVVFGVPYRIFVLVLGLGVAVLSVTGVIIWLNKRRARSLRQAKKGKGASCKSTSDEDAEWRAPETLGE